MNAKRTILYLEQEPQASILRLVLQTNRYRVLKPGDVEAGKLAEAVDLVVIGPRVEFDERVLPVRSLRMQPEMSPAQVLERMRILLVRKRGPKGHA